MGWCFHKPRSLSYPFCGMAVSSAKAAGKPGQAPCPHSRIISSSLTPKQTTLLAGELTWKMMCYVTLATEPCFENWKVVSFCEIRLFSGSASEGKPPGGRGTDVAFFIFFCCLHRRNNVQWWIKQGYQWKSVFSIEKVRNMLTFAQKPVIVMHMASVESAALL